MLNILKQNGLDRLYFNLKKNVYARKKACSISMAMDVSWLSSEVVSVERVPWPLLLGSGRSALLILPL